MEILIVLAIVVAFFGLLFLFILAILLPWFVYKIKTNLDDIHVLLTYLIRQYKNGGCK